MPAPWLRQFRNATATGVLLFLFREVLSHAAEPVEDALVDGVGGKGSWSTFLVGAPIVILRLGIGLLGGPTFLGLVDLVATTAGASGIDPDNTPHTNNINRISGLCCMLVAVRVQRRARLPAGSESVLRIVEEAPVERIAG